MILHFLHARRSRRLSLSDYVYHMLYMLFVILLSVVVLFFVFAYWLIKAFAPMDVPGRASMKTPSSRSHQSNKQANVQR